jgi:hypothetical protein
MDLTTNGVIVTDSIKYVNQKQEQIDTLHKLDERIRGSRRRDYNYKRCLLTDINEQFPGSYKHKRYTQNIIYLVKKYHKLIGRMEKLRNIRYYKSVFLTRKN